MQTDIRHYYVTVKDGPRTGFLLGPYSTHKAALSNIERAKTLAEKADAFAAFYAFGTASVSDQAHIRTVFGE